MIVTRAGHQAFERAVLVEQGINHWLIDPHFEVQLAVPGVVLSRESCILSFAEGLVAANHTVIMRERRKNKYWKDYVLTQFYYGTDFAYFLFGLAWGSAQWERVRNQLLTTIVSTQRLAVLTETGKHYFTKRSERPLALRVPIN